MPQLELIKEIDIEETPFSSLYFNNGVLFGVDSYHSDMSIISPSGEILHNFNLGFEEENQFVFSKSAELPSGVYVSSFESSNVCQKTKHEIRMRDEYEDQGHYEVLFRSDDWLTDRFAVNSLGHIYILEGNNVKIYRDANNLKYEGGVAKYELDTIHTSEERLTHIAIDENDTIFLVEGGKLKIYNSDFTQQYESPLSDEIEEYYSILCANHRLYVTKEENSFCVYHIKY